MKLQLLSDLHLETESYVPTPAPGAELLILAGDIDKTRPVVVDVFDGVVVFRNEAAEKVK